MDLPLNSVVAKFNVTLISAAAFMIIMVVFVLSGIYSDRNSSNEIQYIAENSVVVNGNQINLSIIQKKDGTICSEYIETIQLLSYKETVYTLAERCYEKGNNWLRI